MEQATELRPRGVPSEHRPLRVFVVDDEWLYREAVVSTLASSSDFQVCGQAQDAETALARMEEERPDVAIVDLELPRTGGIELSRQLRSQLPDTRVVVFTVSRNPEDLERALAAGVSGFLIKQDTRDATRLLEAIRIVADGGTLLTSSAARHLLATLASRRREDPAERYGLTRREREVLALLAEGAMNSEIASELSISVQAVKNHLGNIFRKLGVANRTRAAVRARREGLVPPV
jgi:DNA-binding NarL/FixJ family response regulator